MYVFTFSPIYLLNYFKLLPIYLLNYYQLAFVFICNIIPFSKAITIFCLKDLCLYLGVRTRLFWHFLSCVYQMDLEAADCLWLPTYLCTKMQKEDSKESSGLKKMRTPQTSTGIHWKVHQTILRKVICEKMLLDVQKLK